MRWCVFALVVCLCGSRTSKAQEQLTVLPDAPRPQPAIIVGTVTDVNDDTVPGATAVLEGPAPKVPRTVVTNDSREPPITSPSVPRDLQTGSHPPSSSSPASTQS